jgi:hypothetical protein
LAENITYLLLLPVMADPSYYTEFSRQQWMMHQLQFKMHGIKFHRDVDCESICYESCAPSSNPPEPGKLQWAVTYTPKNITDILDLQTRKNLAEQIARQYLEKAWPKHRVHDLAIDKADLTIENDAAAGFLLTIIAQATLEAVVARERIPGELP